MESGQRCYGGLAAYLAFGTKLLEGILRSEKGINQVQTSHMAKI